MSAPTRLLAWDGLSLTAPAAWEPGRLGKGYMQLEDASGPRLELRWQRVPQGFAPEKALKRLARKKQLGKESTSGPAVRSVLEGLPVEAKALACAPPGHGGNKGGTGGKGDEAGEGVLFVLPGAGMAVLAALYPRRTDADAPDAPDWSRIVLSLSDREPGLLSLYDIRALAPPGFRLANFSITLGHYHVQYRSGGDSLDYSRFAPAEVILRSKALTTWASEVFAPTMGSKTAWIPGDLDGMEAAVCGGYRPPGLAGTRLAVFSRLYTPAKWRPAMAWKPDTSKILAVSASHSGGLEPQTFEEICRNYVVVQTP